MERAAPQRDPSTAGDLDEALPLTIEMGSGERLLFREVRADDVSGLRELYTSLDPESTYRRFFTATPPRDPFFERLAAIADRGGCSIVVLDVSDWRDGVPVIVAEADVEPLDNGNGEIAVTVAKRWRGWLGPYLLRLLRLQAARLGIPNLEAEMLSCNRQMRALTRSCGEAVLPRADWQTVRVVFASSGAAPSWPTTTRRKVLVELRSMTVEALAELVAAGDEVIACTGRRSGGPPCPMQVGDDDCPLASAADVIVVALVDPDDRERLVTAHRLRHPGTPVVSVELTPGRPVSGRALVAALGDGPHEGSAPTHQSSGAPG